MSNPLVAQKQDSTTWHSGINVLDDAAGVYQGVQSGSWIEGGIAAFGTGMDLLTIAMNPVGTLISYGLNWLIEHVKPLQDALNHLAGDADQIASYSQTWKNVAQAVQQAGKDLAATVEKDTANWTGQAADTYRADIKNKIDHINAASTCAETISTVVQIVGVITGAVRGLVRDMVTQAIGDFIQDALEEVCSLGLGTPAVVAQVVDQVSAWLEKIGGVIKKLINSVEALRPMMSKLEEIFAAIKKVMAVLHGHPGEAEPHLSGESTHPSSFDDPHTPPAGDQPHIGVGDGTRPSDAGDLGTSDGPTAGNPREPSKSPTRDGIDDPRDPARDGGCKDPAGEPIDTATGSLLLDQVDFELPGLLPLVIARHHCTSYRAGRWFGPTWSSVLDERVEVDAEGVVFTRGDGVILCYPHPVPGRPAWPEEGSRWRMSISTEGGYTITDPDTGQVRHFPERRGDVFPLAAIADRNGNRIAFHYTPGGTPVAVHHDGGFQIRIDTADGQITALHLIDGETEVPLVRYGYTHGQLTEVVDSAGRPSRFTCNDVGWITEWTDRNGLWYRYTYDSRGRCVYETGPDGVWEYTFDYDDENRVTTVTNSLGAVTRYQINEALQVVAVIDPMGGVTRRQWDRYDRLLAETDPLGRTTTYTYDEVGRIVTITRPDGSQSLAEYNDHGLATSLIAPDGAVWRQEFDESGNRTAQIDPNGARTDFTFDDRGHLLSIVDALGSREELETDAVGLPLTVTDATGAITRYQRDRFGRVVAIIDPVGAVTRLGWTTGGRLAWRELPDGARETWTYDGEGNLVEHRDAAGGTTRIEYACFDMPSVRVGPDGARLLFHYDTELQLVSVTNPQGSLWRYSYDPAGRLVAETDFNGRTLHYQHDAAGQLLQRVNGAGEYARYRYDLLGNVVEQVAGTGRGPETVTQFQHDPMGRLVYAVCPDAKVVYERDPVGRVLTETVNGRTMRSTFDALGRRTTRVTPAGATSTWTYDPAGRPRTLTTAGHTIDFERDGAGRERLRRLGPGAVLAQEWDRNDRLREQKLVASSARVIQRRTYNYRADGYVAAIEDQFLGRRLVDLDPAGRVTAVRGRGWTERYVYDPAGNLAAAYWPAGAGQEAVGDREYSGTLISRAGRIGYKHDAEGRIVMRRTATLSGRRDIWRYEWDPEGRLRTVTTPDGQRWRYRYDPLGRRIAKQRLATDGVSVAEQVDFAWDGTVVAEQTTVIPGNVPVRSLSWDYGVGRVAPIAQAERIEWRNAPQPWVDERFYGIVTDLVGTPTELVDSTGALAWYATSSLWGRTAYRAVSTDMPLRFPGQYFDPETGLNYNYHRFYDPDTGRYTSTDPLGLVPAPNPDTYVHNPHTWMDPLGLVCRNGAFREAKREVGIPMSQQPDAVTRVPMTDRWGHATLDSNGRPIITREYHYTRSDGSRVVIQDHGAGHDFGEGGVGNQGPHFNVRPHDNTRTGHVPGTKDHYPYEG